MISKNIANATQLVMGGGYGIQIYDVSAATQVSNNKIVDGAYYYRPLRVEPCSGVTGNTRVTISADYAITGTRGTADC